MLCLGNKMAADKIASKESERTEILKPWITFYACRWDAPTHSEPNPSKVTHFYMKPSSTDTAIICYNFPCQKINWLRPTLNSSQICTNLLKGLSTSRKLLISPIPRFRFLQKPETKQDFSLFPIWCGGTASSNYNASREHRETDTKRKIFETGN